MTTYLLRKRAATATTTVLSARTLYTGRSLQAGTLVSSPGARPARQVLNGPALTSRSAISRPLAPSSSIQRQASTLSDNSSHNNPKFDHSTNHSETHYGRIDCEDQRVWIWWAVPIVGFGIPLYLSYRNDKKLADLAKSKPSSLAESTRKMLNLEERKEGDEPTKTMLNSVWRRRMSEESNERYKRTMTAVSSLPQSVQDTVSEVYLTASQWYVNQPAGKLAVVPIMAINTGVFLMWAVARRRPRWEAWMWRNFTDQDLNWRRPWTMFTHVVSHNNGKRFLFSQWALWTVGGGAVQFWQDRIVQDMRENELYKKMPTEVDYKYQVTAVFLVSALLGRFASRYSSKKTMLRLMHKLETMPQFAHQARRELGELYARRVMGSTAGIYGLFGCAAYVSFFTEQKQVIEIPFLPRNEELTAGKGLLLLTWIEAACYVLGAGRFDHAAHLAGAAAGAFWTQAVSAWWAEARGVRACFDLEEGEFRKELLTEFVKWWQKGHLQKQAQQDIKEATWALERVYENCKRYGKASQQAKEAMQQADDAVKKANTSFDQWMASLDCVAAVKITKEREARPSVREQPEQTS